MNREKELELLIIELRKEKISWRNKIRYIENKSFYSNKCKKYSKTSSGLKSQRKRNWKRSGLNMDNFEENYKRFINTTNCDICNILLTEGFNYSKTTKVMDHNHITGEFRGIICSNCNTKLPRQPT